MTESRGPIGPVEEFDPDISQQLDDVMRERLATYELDDPQKVLVSVLKVVHQALTHLREFVENPDEPDITWDDPYVELQYPVPWKWETEDAANVEVADSAVQLKDDLVKKLVASVLPHQDLLVFQLLTNWVALLKREKKFTYLVPPQLLQVVEKLPIEHRDTVLKRFFQPFSVGAAQIDNDTLLPQDQFFGRFTARINEALHELPNLSFTLRHDGQPYQVSIVADFPHLIIDETNRRAYFPVVTGIAISENIASPATWDEADRKDFWDAILRRVVEGINITLNKAYPFPAEGELLQKSMDEFEVPRETLLPSPDIGPRRSFPLPMGTALIDREIHEIISTTVRTRGLFSRWSELPELEQEIAGKARCIYEEGGEEELRRHKGGVRRASDGMPEPYLAADSITVRDLTIQLGMDTGYRRQDSNTRDIIASGGLRQYACRVFETDRGFVEIGLSWNHLAGPWVDQWHAELQSQIDAQQARIRELEGRAQHSLFPDVEREEIERLTELLDHASESITLWRRGHTLMGLIQSQVYHQRSNWVKIPAEAMRMALWDVAGKTPPADWKQELDNALASLATVMFSVRGLAGEKVRGFGHFLGEVWYEDTPVLVPRGDQANPPQPPHEVSKREYLLNVQPGFVGCLRAFQAGESRLGGSAMEAMFDWTRKISAKDRKKVAEETGASTSGTYLPFDPARYLAQGARGLSSMQRALDDCLEREITLNWQRGKKGKRMLVTNALGGRERLYSSEDCPLLPEGLPFVLAGGNGPRAGMSYTVAGARPKQRRGGWMAKIGYTVPDRRGGLAYALAQLLDDFETVVQGYYGGVVCGYKAGSWLTLEEIRKLPTRATMTMNLRAFLPADYQTRTRQAIADQGIAVHDTALEIARAEERANPVSPGKIRAYRKSLKMKQGELADYLGVTQSMVSQIENGKRPIPDELVPPLMNWLAAADDNGNA